MEHRLFNSKTLGNVGIGNTAPKLPGLETPAAPAPASSTPATVIPVSGATGSFNAGGFNPGDSNTGDFSPGSWLTGLGNAAMLNRRLLRQLQQRVLVSGNYRGLIGLHAALVPETALTRRRHPRYLSTSTPGSSPSGLQRHSCPKISTTPIIIPTINITLLRRRSTWADPPPRYHRQRRYRLHHHRSCLFPRHRANSERAARRALNGGAKPGDFRSYLNVRCAGQV